MEKTLEELFPLNEVYKPPTHNDIRDVEVEIISYEPIGGVVTVEVKSSYDPDFVANGRIYIKETTKINLEKHITEHSRYVYCFSKMLDKYESEKGRNEKIDELVGKTLKKQWNNWEE